MNTTSHLDQTTPQASAVGEGLGNQMRLMHEQLLELIPDVDRIACVLYDKRDAMLRTFVNSTRHGEAIKGYEFPLQESASLSELAATGQQRVIDEIADAVQPTSPHSDWLLRQGYRSSLTVPLFDKGGFIGFLFYNSCQPAAFTESVQHKLSLFSTLINMTISNEINIAQTITTSAQVAREFANLRDFETGSHLDRMAHYARLIARELQPAYNLSDEYIEHLYLFAPLHDIGKIGIPDSVLLKPGQLNGEERKLMETHVDKGVEVLEKLIGEFGMESLPDSLVMRNVVAGHHECIDGSGYPHGLKGDAVTMEARIIAVADVLDALISHRPYKEPWPIEKAIAELERLVEIGKFDGECVEAVKKHRAEILAIRDRFSEVPSPSQG
ncbi:MAG: HD-GYP domain-containing protein [Prochlorococcaceae cyanobacterium]|jgi:HD-GYP domain-containing protein (c-di-GMP phosphodiesterase class II)